MWTLLINGFLGLTVFGALGGSDTTGWWWAALWGVLSFVVLQGVSGYLIQRRVKGAMGEVQQVMEAGQRRLQQRMNQWQMRPMGSIKQMQQEIEREQRVLVEQALEASKGLDKFERWALLMGRQSATLRLQLYWMIKEFKRVDELMPKALLMDPLMGAIKLTRMYMLEVDGDALEKFFKSQVLKLRHGQGELLYALYAWVLIKRGDVAGAHKVLLQGCEKMESDVLKRNRDVLANNRVNQFNNAGLGESWYALHLEQPKVRVQRQQGFGGRRF